MYSIHGFGEMIDDRVRMDAYARALQRTVVKDAVVADLGAGTGVMSLLACKLGARRVYAIEPSPVALLIPEFARENGCEDRIVVLRKRSTEATLPERADVIVSDMRGVLSAFHRHLADLADARRRLLAPSGTLIPAIDTLWVAPVAAEVEHAAARRIWRSAPYGLAMQSGLRPIDHTWMKHRARPEDLLSEPAAWARIEYGAESDFHVRGAARCEIARRGVSHGLLVWFDTVLLGDIGFSNHPAAPRALYGQALFPWPEPVALEPGDALAIELRADPLGDEYAWTWTTELRRAAHGDAVAARFRQSQLLAYPVDADRMRKRAETFQPALGASGAAVRFVLERMQSRTSVGALATSVREAFPEQFDSYSAALEFVCGLSERYGE